MKDAPLSPSILCRLASLLAVACAWLSASANPLPSEWKEWRGFHYRVEADGNFSCYSENGRDCRWGLTAIDPIKAARPLVCGSAHRAVWPSTGYERPGHWCNVAYANLFAVWHDYTLLGHRGELSKNARGDTMCRSLDGVTCQLLNASNADPLAGGGSPSAPSTATAEIQPLVCGAALQRRLGITGYDDPGHWCNLPEIVARWVAPPPTGGAHGPMDNGGDTGWLYKDTLLPMPSLTVDEGPLWIAKIRTWSYHAYAAIDISRGDDSLVAVSLGGIDHRTEPVGSNPDTVLHVGGAKDAITPVEYKLRRFDDAGLRRHVFSFQVQGNRRAIFRRSSQMIIPSRASSSGPWAPEHDTFTVDLPADWGRSTAGGKETTFRLYVDNTSHPTTRSSLTEVEELVVAKKRVRPAD